MSDHEQGGNIGLETLTGPEQKQFRELRDEIIALYNIYNATGKFQKIDGQLVMPIKRLQSFAELLTKTGIHFEQLDTPLQVAIQSLRLTENLFPGMSIPAFEEEVFPKSTRPEVEEDEGLTTLIMTEDELRKELGILIQTVKTAMERETVEPHHLKLLCDEIVNQCKAYGGVFHYTGDSVLSDFIVSHSHLGGEKSFEQPPTPPLGTPRPVTEEQNSDRGLRAAVKRLFWKK